MQKDSTAPHDPEEMGDSACAASLLKRRALDELSVEELELVVRAHPFKRTRRSARAELRSRASDLYQAKRWDHMVDDEARFVSRHHPDGHVRSVALEHVRARERRAASSQDITRSVDTVHRLDFDFLPAGTWTMDHVAQHYQSAAQRADGGEGGRAFDWGRLLEIGRLSPSECYVGREGWKGYVVFTFESTSRVLLECPIEGNALYVLDENWKTMLGLSKGEIRERHQGQHVRVVHRGDWLSRAETALASPPQLPCGGGVTDAVV